MFRIREYQFKNNLSFLITSMLFIAFYSYVIINFVSHDGLSSLASDSANYMVMALYLSPWVEAPPEINALWTQQDYPPLFPLILAITGAVHNLVFSHIITTLFLIISLPLIYLFYRQCLIPKWPALILVLLFAISPSTIMNTLGILSENLYIFISFILLVLSPKLEDNSLPSSITYGVMLALLVLSRTIGISLFSAFVVIGYLNWKKNIYKNDTYFLPIIIFFIINLTARFLHDSSVPTQYIRQLADLNLTSQLQALVDAWFSAWQYYWLDDLTLPYFIVLITGVLSLSGLLARLYQKKTGCILYPVLYHYTVSLAAPGTGIEVYISRSGDIISILILCDTIFYN